MDNKGKDMTRIPGNTGSRGEEAESGISYLMREGYLYFSDGKLWQESGVQAYTDGTRQRGFGMVIRTGFNWSKG